MECVAHFHLQKFQGSPLVAAVQEPGLDRRIWGPGHRFHLQGSGRLRSQCERQDEPSARTVCHRAGMPAYLLLSEALA